MEERFPTQEELEIETAVEIFNKYYWFGATERELSAEFGMPLTAVCRTISKARYEMFRAIKTVGHNTHTWASWNKTLVDARVEALAKKKAQLKEPLTPPPESVIEPLTLEPTEETTDETKETEEDV